ncbi:cuticle protein AMP1A-like [Wyeomyia smithii]|uniref:cuticle protein AMP1A-like n=1 Tax=Wyeomyia smithii TaxID=174621 RepID=UPI002467E14E|nr:cuticle protein AMP1A-like [Wyeomyia smithii]
MWSTLVMLSLLLVTALSAPQRRFGGDDDRSAVTLVDDYSLNPDGSYNYKYETSNDISAAQSGGAGGQYANGYFSYLSPDGSRVQVTYLADENGFQPQGDHLPVEPPAPDHVIQSLEQIRAAAYPGSGLDIATLDATIARLRATRG